jgi:N-acetylneuraminic acid mutarotase
VKLLDGRVLVMGGCAASGCGADTATAEIFDPASGQWSAAAPMKAHRASFSATRLADGRVLVTGGYNATGILTENETYDPASDSWTVNPPMPHAHAVHVSVTMSDGRVLVAGGDTGLGLPGREAEIFDPVKGKWKAAAPMAAPREYFGAANLPNGKVLMIGGYSLKGEMFVSLKSCEIFHPHKAVFTAAPSMKHERTEFSVTTLPDGRVMAVGGDAHRNGEFPVPSDAELFKP